MNFGPNIGPNTQFLPADGKGLLSSGSFFQATVICLREATP